MISQGLLLLYFKMDNGSNVCGIEFNYNNNGFSRINEEENSRSITVDEESNRELVYNDQSKSEAVYNEQSNSRDVIYNNRSNSEVIFNNKIFRQLFLGFEVVSEEGRSEIFVSMYIKACGFNAKH